MKNKSYYIGILIPILFFFIISILSIYSSQSLLSSSFNDLYIKQLIWYIIGFIIIMLITSKKLILTNRTINLLYILSIGLLTLVLIIGEDINGSRCWINLPKIGSFQPSEFMKISLILILAKELDKFKIYKKNTRNEFIIIIKCLMLTILPTILTFLEPDTGNVIIYFIILIVMLFIYGIRIRWYLLSIIIISIVLFSFFYLFFNMQEKFISIFGTNFFYRIDRIMDWSNKDGMQLTNALASTGSAGFFGYKIGNIPIYFPEPQTDFIFSVYSSTFGFIGSIFLITLICIFDLTILKISLNKDYKEKYILIGFLGMIVFQQIQNIGMNIGLLPITGITLPFISYGGSSLISYMIIIGITLNIINKKEYYE